MCDFPLKSTFKSFFNNCFITKVTLDLLTHFEEVFLPDDIFMLIKLDIKRIQLLKLEVDAYSIAYR